MLKDKLISVYPTARILEHINCVGHSTGKVNPVKQRRKLHLAAFGVHRSNTLCV